MAVLACTSVAQAQQPQPVTSGLVIQLEQYRAGTTIPVRPEHVFATGDYVRFHLQTPTHGYLYVIDQGTSGAYAVLFPSTNSSSSNEIGNAAEAFVPASNDGWFQVGGPAGFDTVYFLLSPTPLAVGTTGAQAPAAPPPNLLPRCNDAIFQARGECIDTTAGPATLPRGTTLPPQITTAAPQASRDLFLTDERTGTVQPSKTIAGPVVYAFRIAHK